MYDILSWDIHKIFASATYCGYTLQCGIIIICSMGLPNIM